MQESRHGPVLKWLCSILVVVEEVLQNVECLLRSTAKLDEWDWVGGLRLDGLYVSTPGQLGHRSILLLARAVALLRPRHRIPHYGPNVKVTVSTSLASQVSRPRRL